MKPVDKLLRAVGENIRTIRKEKGLTHKEVASRSGMHVTSLPVIERGRRNLTLATISRIADALDTPPVELLRCGEDSDRQT